MKKLAFVFFAFLAACGNREKSPEVSSNVFLENQLQQFIAANPAWTKDEASLDETTDQFKRTTIKWSNEQDFLKDMPLELKGFRDTILGDQATKLATFKAYGDKNRGENSLLDRIQLQIDGILSDEHLEALKVGQRYTLSGTLYKQGKRDDVKFINVADFKGYDLGKYLFFVNEATPLP